MSTSARRLIVGAAGGAIGFGTIRSVRERWGHSVEVIAIDINPRELVAASAIADAFLRVPPARSRDFPAALATCGAGDYLPTQNDEIEVVSRLVRDGALPPGLRVVAPPNEVVRRCIDKWELHRWLEARGVPTPRTALAEAGALSQFPDGAILKPRNGSGGEATAPIRTADALAGLAPGEWLLQESLRGPEIAIDVFHGRSGRTLRTACREYLERKATVATKVRIFEDRALAEIAARLARELPLTGAFMFQAMRDTAEGWRVIDVNPRIGSGTRMSAALGLDFAAANLGDFWGEPVEEWLGPLTGEHFVVRQYEEYVTGGRR